MAVSIRTGLNDSRLPEYSQKLMTKLYQLFYSFPSERETVYRRIDQESDRQTARLADYHEKELSKLPKQRDADYSTKKYAGRSENRRLFQESPESFMRYVNDYREAMEEAGSRRYNLRQLVDQGVEEGKISNDPRSVLKGSLYTLRSAIPYFAQVLKFAQIAREVYGIVIDTKSLTKLKYAIDDAKGLSNLNEESIARLSNDSVAYAQAKADVVSRAFKSAVSILGLISGYKKQQTAPSPAVVIAISLVSLLGLSFLLERQTGLVTSAISTDPLLIGLVVSILVMASLLFFKIKRSRK